MGNDSTGSSSHIPQSTKVLPLRLILPVTSIGTFISAMDGSIVNVSLPTITAALNTTEFGIRWIVIIYLLTISSFISIGGFLGDSYGRKKVFQSGMALFIVGSLFCAFSPSLEFLILSRAMQAIGAAGLMANGLALVITYVEPSNRGRAIGINSFVVASALSTGPVLGGILTYFVGWPSIFLINIPIGLAGIILVQKIIPETPRKSNITPDYAGMITFIIVAFSLVQGILIFFEGNFIGVILITIALIGGVVFIFIEGRHPRPMISVRIMKNRTILTGFISSFLCYMVYYGVIFRLPFFYTSIWEFDELIIGFLMVVPPIAMAIMGPIGGLAAENIEAKKLATSGAVLLGCFLMLLAFLINQELYIIVPLVALSAGFLTMFTVSNGTSVMNAAPKDDVSVVSGLIGLSRNIGFTLGITFSSALFGVFFAIYNPENITSGNIFYTSYYQSLGFIFIIFAILAVLGALISALREPKKNKINAVNVRV